MPMARRLTIDPGKVVATRQRIHEAVTAANWDEAELYRCRAIRVSKKLPGIEAFVLDDTGSAKNGKHSAGVHRQYSGTLGRVDNYQVATSLHLASESGGACIGVQRFLAQTWADAPERRKKAGIPDDIEHQPKWQIGLNLLDRALGWGVASHVVLADSGYGDCTAFRQALEDRALAYVVGVSSGMSVWPPLPCKTPLAD